MVADRICLNAVCDLEGEKKEREGMGRKGKKREGEKSERGDLSESLRD